MYLQVTDARVSKVYGALFKEVNPPARTTIACGDILPHGINVIIHLNFSKLPNQSHPKKALHVQSRSYWAPANIGPYSQAQSVPLLNNSEAEANLFLVHIAGQIPLIPCTMTLPKDSNIENPSKNYDTSFKTQIVLSLQHLWRIGQVMHVSWWTGAVAYFSRDSLSNISRKAKLAGFAWEDQHLVEKTTDEDPELEDNSKVPDLWEAHYHGGVKTMGGSITQRRLPNWSVVSSQDDSNPALPPFFAAEVEALPRGSDIEWHAILGLTDGPVKVSPTFTSTNHAWHELLTATRSRHTSNSESAPFTGALSEIRNCSPCSCFPISPRYMTSRIWSIAICRPLRHWMSMNNGKPFQGILIPLQPTLMFQSRAFGILTTKITTLSYHVGRCSTKTGIG